MSESKPQHNDELAVLRNVHKLAVSGTLPIDTAHVAIAGYLKIPTGYSEGNRRALPLCLLDGDFASPPHDLGNAQDLTYFTYDTVSFPVMTSPQPPVANLAVRWESRVIVPTHGEPYACSYHNASPIPGNKYPAHIFASPIPYDDEIFSDRVNRSF